MKTKFFVPAVAAAVLLSLSTGARAMQYRNEPSVACEPRNVKEASITYCLEEAKLRADVLLGMMTVALDELAYGAKLPEESTYKTEALERAVQRVVESYARYQTAMTHVGSLQAERRVFEAARQASSR